MSVLNASANGKVSRRGGTGQLEEPAKRRTAVVFYGAGPSQDLLAKINAPFSGSVGRTMHE
jgi:hypothetical protein